MTKDETKHLQQALNNFTREAKLGFTDLIIDGAMGAHTKQRIRDCKYFLGYQRTSMTLEVNANFLWRLRNREMVSEPHNQTKEAVALGKKRRATRRRWNARNKVRAFLKPGVGTFDGHPVAKCAIPILQWCRNNGWPGQLVSGWRSAAYSEQLCYRMCGRPSCPGMCAGRATNHTGNSPERFAVDVSAYAKFREVVAKCPLQPHIHNSLPRDLVHFSPSGN